MSNLPSITFKEVTTLLYAGPAIIHADTFYQDELAAGKIKDTNYQIYSILNTVGLVDDKGILTPVGNETFACIDLIRYYLITGGEMAVDKHPPKEDWKYDLLRKGLGQHAFVRSIDYLDFIHTYVKQPIDTVIDVGGGDGSYLELVCEKLDVKKGILLDKNIEVVSDRMNALYPNSNKYQFVETDISKPFKYKLSPYKADLILLIEVLHLDDDQWWDDLITNSLLALKPGGQLCIGEVQPEPAFDWRMKSYTKKGMSMDIEYFMSWFHGIYEKNFEEKVGVLTLSTHWFVILTKRGKQDA